MPVQLVRPGVAWASGRAVMQAQSQQAVSARAQKRASGFPSLTRQQGQGQLAASRGDAPPGRAGDGAHSTMPENGIA